jgi:SAM-dependent methyltransferase
VSVEHPRLYGNLASWFHLLTPPDEYAEEAEVYRRLLVEGVEVPVRTVLELGSGGGNNAFHLKHYFDLTLTDLSEAMLAASRSINPECAHIQADMRTVRLGREFDAVFVHDAIDYMTSEKDLQAAVVTAYVHCRPGGVALFVPDYVRETFRPRTEHGGNDDGLRGLRYLEWDWDPDPDDDTYVVDFAYLLRHEDGSVRAEHDRHLGGLFGRDTWMELLREAGFDPQRRALSLDDVVTESFLGVRPPE